MAELKEHGIEQATYLNGPYGYRPSLACLCGWVTQGDSWAAVGEDLDDHLARENAIPVQGAVS